MSTIYVFDDEVDAATEAADGDRLLIGDVSAGVKKYITAALLRQSLDGAIVSTSATELSITAAAHAGRVVDVASAAPIAITLPAATGTGNKYTFVLSVAATGTAHTITVANTVDDMAGSIAIFDTSATTEPEHSAIAFAATATDDTITLNGTTQSGTVGTKVEIIDVASGLFSARLTGAATGSYATPFSAT